MNFDTKDFVKDKDRRLVFHDNAIELFTRNTGGYVTLVGASGSTPKDICMRLVQFSDYDENSQNPYHNKVERHFDNKAYLLYSCSMTSDTIEMKRRVVDEMRIHQEIRLSGFLDKLCAEVLTTPHQMSHMKLHVSVARFKNALDETKHLSYVQTVHFRKEPQTGFPVALGLNIALEINLNDGRRFAFDMDELCRQYKSSLQPYPSKSSTILFVTDKKCVPSFEAPCIVNKRPLVFSDEWKVVLGEYSGYREEWDLPEIDVLDLIVPSESATILSEQIKPVVEWFERMIVSRDHNELFALPDEHIKNLTRKYKDLAKAFTNVSNEIESLMGGKAFQALKES